jgi:hypothetical protein
MPVLRPGVSLARLRGVPLLLLAGVVAALHLVGLSGLAAQLAPAAADRPERLTATYVAELVAAAPVSVAVAAAAPPMRPSGTPRSTAVAVPMPTAPAAPPPEPAASAPQPTEPPLESALDREPGLEPSREPVLQPDPSLPADPPLAQGVPASPVTELPASGGTGLEAAAAVPGPVWGGSSLITAEPLPSFEWPPSTRLSYHLLGHYRGEVQGFAQVEWLREGERYQVHLEVIIGLPVAPLMSRRMSSDGRLAPEGLVPVRYDEVTRIAFRPERAATVRLDDGLVQLADGSVRARPRGVQDTASQFVQMAYLFALEPDRLAPGRTLELPLALPRRLDLWVYDVLGEEAVDTPFGAVQTVHLRPRPLGDRRDTLTAEVWIAPTLRFLPVRLLIRQDEQTYMDLVLSRRPEIAAR